MTLERMGFESWSRRLGPEAEKINCSWKVWKHLFQVRFYFRTSMTFFQFQYNSPTWAGTFRFEAQVLTQTFTYHENLSNYAGFFPTQTSIFDFQTFQYPFSTTCNLKVVSHLRMSTTAKSDFCGYIDVGDACWRRNVLVTILRCWWRVWPFLTPLSPFF